MPSLDTCKDENRCCQQKEYSRIQLVPQRLNAWNDSRASLISKHIKDVGDESNQKKEEIRDSQHEVGTSKLGHPVRRQDAVHVVYVEAPKEEDVQYEQSSD